MGTGALPWIAAAALAGVLVLALVAGARGASDFEIRGHRGGRVQVRGRIPKAKVGEIQEFFGQDLGLSRPVVVRGSFGPDRVPRLRFSGSISAGQRQRARNFLMELLR